MGGVRALGVKKKQKTEEGMQKERESTTCSVQVLRQIQRQCEQQSKQHQRVHFEHVLANQCHPD